MARSLVGPVVQGSLLWLVVAFSGAGDEGGSQNDETPCTLVDGELASSLLEFVQHRGVPGSQESQFKRVWKALEEHRAGHGWPHSIEHQIPPSNCPDRSLRQLRAIGTAFGSEDLQFVIAIAEILERSGRVEDSLALLLSVPLVVDDPSGRPFPPGSREPSVRPWNLDERIGDMERRRGRWDVALDVYTRWRPRSSCGNGQSQLSLRRALHRLECLSILGRWEEYREVCGESLCGLWDPVFATHWVEYYRAQGSLSRAVSELDELFVAQPESFNEGRRSFLKPHLEDLATKARERARLHLEFLTGEEAGDFSKLPDELRAGLPFDVALAGVRRGGPDAVFHVLSVCAATWNHGENCQQLLDLAASTGDPQVRPFLTDRRGLAPYLDRELDYLLRTLDLAAQGVDVRRTIDKGLYLP